jgi:UDP-3-O-[3-hydroxymyristoyl] N-acetylglucosamine deacetylase
MLEQAGVCALRKRRRYLKVVKPFEVAEGDRRIGVYPAENFSVHCLVEYKHPEVGQQEISLDVTRESFSTLLAPARTFGFTRDFDGLRAMGLIRGGSMENAIVLDENRILNGPLRCAAQGAGPDRRPGACGKTAAGAGGGAQGGARIAHAVGKPAAGR